MLRESVLNQVETCGEQITKQLNSCTRNLVQHLMNIVVTQVSEELSSKAKKVEPAKDIAKTGSESKDPPTPTTPKPAPSA